MDSSPLSSPPVVIKDYPPAPGSPSQKAAKRGDYSQSPEVFAHFENYPWASDDAFQYGLSSILGPDAESMPKDQAERLALQARCFYYERKYGIKIDTDAYILWREDKGDLPADSVLDGIKRNKSASIPSGNLTDADQSFNELQKAIADPSLVVDRSSADAVSAEDQPKPATFEEIMRLIENNESPPGVKEIPKTILEGAGTNATMQPRKKPWEK